MRATWFLITLVLLSAGLCYSQAAIEGKVVGVVVDEQNQPINGAQVCTRVASRSGGAVGNCLALTDRGGQFEIEHLPLGTMSIVASKMEDGFVESHQAPGMQSVTLTAEAPQASIVLKLGPREGILVPTVKDANSGAPVYDFTLTWRPVSAQLRGNAGGAGFSRWVRSTPIPAEQDIVIDAVSARGYKLWRSDQYGPVPLRLERGEQRAVTFELEPDDATALVGDTR